MWGAQMPSRCGAESDEAPRCRICFDGASEEDGDLIEPCACRGTQRYIHKSCLVQWQASFFSIRRPPPFCSSLVYPIVCLIASVGVMHAGSGKLHESFAFSVAFSDLAVLHKRMLLSPESHTSAAQQRTRRDMQRVHHALLHPPAARRGSHFHQDAAVVALRLWKRNSPICSRGGVTSDGQLTIRSITWFSLCVFWSFCTRLAMTVRHLGW
jgi:hypothetical protein